MSRSPRAWLPSPTTCRATSRASCGCRSDVLGDIFAGDDHQLGRSPSRRGQPGPRTCHTRAPGRRAPGRQRHDLCLHQSPGARPAKLARRRPRCALPASAGRTGQCWPAETRGSRRRSSARRAASATWNTASPRSRPAARRAAERQWRISSRHRRSLGPRRSQTAAMPEDMKINMPDPSGDEAYPIVTFTWELLRNAPEDRTKDEAIRAFTRWAIAEGQDLATGLGYVPMPQAVRDRAGMLPFPPRLGVARAWPAFALRRAPVPFVHGLVLAVDRSPLCKSRTRHATPARLTAASPARRPIAACTPSRDMRTANPRRQGLGDQARHRQPPHQHRRSRCGPKRASGKRAPRDRPDAVPGPIGDQRDREQRRPPPRAAQGPPRSAPLRPPSSRSGDAARPRPSRRRARRLAPARPAPRGPRRSPSPTPPACRMVIRCTDQIAAMTPADGQDDRQQPDHRALVGPAPRREVPPRRAARRAPAGFARDREKCQRQGHHEMQSGIGEAGAAPADGLDEPGRQRPADRAGEPAPERQLGDRAAGLRAVEPPERREGRVVEPSSHARRRSAPRRPDRPARSAPRPCTASPAASSTRAGRQHLPAAVLLDRPPHPERDRSGDQQPQRHPGDDPSVGPAGVLGRSGQPARREGSRTTPRRGSG